MSKAIYLEPRKTYASCILHVQNDRVYYSIKKVLDVLLEMSFENVQINRENASAEMLEEFSNDALEYFYYNIHSASRGRYSPVFIDDLRGQT